MKKEEKWMVGLACIIMFTIGLIAGGLFVKYTTDECIDYEICPIVECEECSPTACKQVMNHCEACPDVDCYGEVNEAIKDYRQLEEMFDDK